VGLVGPGLASWDAAREILAGNAAYSRAATVIPSPDALPATERRRAGKCVRIAIAAGLAAAKASGGEARDLAAVFASSTGDAENLHAICEQLASDDRLISPTRFHNSVHNAPSGYWGIATGATPPADSVAAFDASFGAGLLEALGRLAEDPSQGVLLVAYDAPYPEPLAATRPIADAFAVALALEWEGAGPRLRVKTTRDAAGRMDDAALEAIRAGIPAARSLPLLGLLAKGSGRAVLGYLDDLSLEASVEP
jgi:hypothetical protein